MGEAPEPNPEASPATGPEASPATGPGTAARPGPETGYPTALGASTRTSITLLGEDLAADIMGTVGFGELAFRLATQRRPSAGEVRVFEAVLAALADHGFTPTALVTRLTYLSAPDSVQGALAAGLLGGGSRFLGVTEDCGRFLHEALAALEGPPPADDAGWDAVALRLVRARRAAGERVPGLGHHVHKDGDPRTPRLQRIAAEEGLYGPHLSLFAAIGRVHPQVLRRTLPLNGAGVCGAALADLGLPTELLRAFALLARTAGLIGQLAEELRNPVGEAVFLSVDLNNRPVPPDPYRPDPDFPPAREAHGGPHG
ncbi:citryl-CoA lyase [Streptomyces sp. NPDC059255]|uniref:citryl-CoA lyase n=1 Tax=Streptomyces sp. NPDC059255 TaxID=3346793 RepID=UPI00368F3238